MNTFIKLPERIWVTGAPGSRWTGVVKKIEDRCPEYINTTDRLAPGRERDMCNPKFTPASPKGFHKGAYFGRGMEFESIVDGDYVDQPFDSSHGGCKMIKSHEWAEKLPEIREKYPDDWIWLIYRPDDACFAWWYQLGGFNIKYPDYSHFQNQSRIMACIKEQNYNMLNFAYNYDATWNYMSTKWVKKTFGLDAPFWEDTIWKESPMYKETNDGETNCPVTYKQILPYCDILTTVIKPD